MTRFLIVAPLGALGLLALAGCGGEPKASATAASVTAPPRVTVVRPLPRTIVRTVGQPGFVDTYEQTAIYPKMTAYLEKWNVDIGDAVKRGDVLATLFVPELVEEYQTKLADLELAKELIHQAEKAEQVAQANVKAAIAKVAEEKANLGKFQAEVDRWDSEVKRLTKMVSERVVDRQILDESTRQLKSNIAERDAAQSAIQAATAQQLSAESSSEKASVDVRVAQANAKVAKAEAKRLEALVGYLKLTAPYDGVVVARNANTGDFVLPATGDPSASPRSVDQSAARASPIFVVARTDLLRIYVDVPEKDANYVQKGSKATVLARAYRDRELPATVTRTSWALNVRSRTLRAEIDLPNPEARILPGMYAYGKVIIERPNVHALPVEALAYSGDRTYCWRLVDGKAERIEIETGVSDGSWIEVTNHRPARPGGDPDAEPWVPFDGSESIILGDLSILTPGSPVTVVTDEPAKAKAAPEPPSPPAQRAEGGRGGSASVDGK